MFKNKINTTLHYARPNSVGNAITKSSIKVKLMSQFIIAMETAYDFNAGRYYTFDYDMSGIIEKELNGEFNVMIKYRLGREQPQKHIPTKLNWFERQQLKWMFGRHHIQRNWQFWLMFMVGLLALPFIYKLISDIIGCDCPEPDPTRTEMGPAE